MSARPASASSLVAIIGGGPAGLMAAEVLANAGVRVELFDAMPSVGRKFLLAGVGGMNITHSEAKAPFLSRYREREPEIATLLADFDAETLRAWVAQEIGAIAKPKDIRFGDNLPKTRSGKIMRRLLRQLARGEAITQDVSTLENPAILDQLRA